MPSFTPLIREAIRKFNWDCRQLLTASFVKSRSHPKDHFLDGLLTATFMIGERRRTPEGLDLEYYQCIFKAAISGTIYELDETELRAVQQLLFNSEITMPSILRLQDRAEEIIKAINEEAESCKDE